MNIEWSTEEQHVKHWHGFQKMAKEDLEDLGSPGATQCRGSAEHRDDTDRLWRDCWWPSTVEKLAPNVFPEHVESQCLQCFYHHKFITRIHPVHLMNSAASAMWPSTPATRPSQQFILTNDIYCYYSAKKLLLISPLHGQKKPEMTYTMQWRCTAHVHCSGWHNKPWQDSILSETHYDIYSESKWGCKPFTLSKYNSPCLLDTVLSSPLKRHSIQQILLTFCKLPSPARINKRITTLDRHVQAYLITTFTEHLHNISQKCWNSTRPKMQKHSRRSLTQCCQVFEKNKHKILPKQAQT